MSGLERPKLVRQRACSHEYTLDYLYNRLYEQQTKKARIQKEPSPHKANEPYDIQRPLDNKPIHTRSV